MNADLSSREARYRFPDRVHDAVRIIVTRKDGATVEYSTCDLETDESLWEETAPFAIDAVKVEFKRIVCEHYDSP